MTPKIVVLLLLATAIASADGAKPTPTAAKQTEAEQNKALIERFYTEVWNKGHLAVADEVFAKDYVRHDASGGPPSNRSGVTLPA
jgi:hypothetical protein